MFEWYSENTELFETGGSFSAPNKVIPNVVCNERWLYGQDKRFHINRIIGCNCHHRLIDGDIDAGPAAGEETGKGYYMPIETKTMGPYVRDVHARERRLFQ
jgi:hypothetical protein